MKQQSQIPCGDLDWLMLMTRNEGIATRSLSRRAFLLAFFIYWNLQNLVELGESVVPIIIRIMWDLIHEIRCLYHSRFKRYHPSQFAFHMLVSCTNGTYLDKETGECLDCPKGTYQDEEAKEFCYACPNGHPRLASAPRMLPPAKVCLLGVFAFSLCFE